MTSQDSDSAVVTAEDVHTFQLLKELVSAIYLPIPTCKIHLARPYTHDNSTPWRAAVIRNAYGIWKFVSPIKTGATRTEALKGLLEWMEGFSDEMMGKCYGYCEVGLEGGEDVGGVNMDGVQQGVGGEQDGEHGQYEQGKRLGVPDVLMAVLDEQVKRRREMEGMSGQALGGGMAMEMGTQPNANSWDATQRWGGLQQQQQQHEQFPRQQETNFFTPSQLAQQHQRSSSQHTYRYGLRDMVGASPSELQQMISALTSDPIHTPARRLGLSTPEIDSLFLSSPPTLRGRSSSTGEVFNADDAHMPMRIESMPEYGQRLNPQWQVLGSDMNGQMNDQNNNEDMMEEDGLTIMGERRVSKVDDEDGQNKGLGLGYDTQRRQEGFMQQARGTGRQTARKGPAGPDFYKKKTGRKGSKK